MRSLFTSHGLTRFLALGGGGHQHSHSVPASDPTTQCSLSLSASGGPTANCGSSGTLASPSLISASHKEQVDNCTRACYNNHACHSFGFSAAKGAGQNCKLYSKALEGMGYTPSSTGKTLYYDRACITQSCPNIMSENGDFNIPAWAFGWSIGGYGLSEFIESPGYESEYAGYVAYTNSSYANSTTQFYAYYTTNITFGQQYQFEMEYKPHIQGCVTNVYDGSGSVVFLSLGSGNGTIGESAPLGNWSHYSTKFLIPPQFSPPPGDTFHFVVYTYCPAAPDPESPPPIVVEYDNFAATALPHAPYLNTSKQTGSNLVKNGGFEMHNLNAFQKLATNATTNFVEPGADGTGSALAVHIPQPGIANGAATIFAATGLLLGQTIATQAGKAYSISLAYKLVAPKGQPSNATYVCELLTLLINPTTTFETLQELSYTLPVLLGGPTNFDAEPEDSWTVMTGSVGATQDNMTLVVAPLCATGSPVTFLLDDLEVFEFA